MTLTRSKRGLIIINAFWEGGYTYFVSRMQEELTKLGLNIDTVKNNRAICYIQDGKIYNSVSHYDFILYLDKDPHMAKMLEDSGTRLFNRAEAIRQSDDKMLTHIALSGKGIYQPNTVSSPLFFAGEDNPEFLDKVENLIHYPIVVKENYGSFGKGVFLAKDRKELQSLRAKLLSVPHLYQQYVECDSSDYRLIVIGGKVVAAMRRKAVGGDFRSNIGLGGVGSAVIPTEPMRQMAAACAITLGLDYCGVDILKGEDGNLYIAEVNSNAMFAAAEKATGVNVALAYAKLILAEVYEA